MKRSGDEPGGVLWPPGRRREEVEALARRLATPEGLREVRRRQAAGTLAPGAPDPVRPRPEPTGESAAGPRPISIWHPVARRSESLGDAATGDAASDHLTSDGPASGADSGAGSGADSGEGTMWRRPAPLPLGDHYAATRELRARRPGGPRRVCFFGESAAAGYLYAPHLTPARVLETQLAALDGPGRWEVIDLARTNERLATLAATAEAAMQLAPDLLVVYAGNNWTLLETPELSPFAPSVTARQRLAAALRAGGRHPRAMAEAAARLARRELAGRAAAALERIGRAAAAAGVPVIVVLPEVNLADWETRQPPALLFGEDAARWHGHLARGLDALAAGDVAAAETAAWAMVELDGGLCPTPFRLLAEAARRDGRDADARDAAISETDALHYPLMAFLAAPRAGSAERRILAAEAERRGWGTVDLRQVFAEATGSVLPGRRLFLDYCHLTREGMKIAMAAVTAEVLRRTAKTGPPADATAPPTGAADRGLPAGPGARGTLDDLLRTGLLHAEPGSLARLLAALPDPEIAPEAEALAFFGAAVHTAHRHLPVTDRGELLIHWCRRALAASPGVAAAMLDLADARTAPLPEALTAAQQRTLRADHPLTLQHGWRWDGADADLLAALRSTLAEADRPEAATLDRLLAERSGEPPPERSGERPGERSVARPGEPSAEPRRIHRASPELLPAHLAEPLARPFPEAMAPAGLAPRATLRCLWPVTELVTAHIAASVSGLDECDSEQDRGLDGGPDSRRDTSRDGAPIPAPGHDRSFAGETDGAADGGLQRQVRELEIVARRRRPAAPGNGDRADWQRQEGTAAAAAGAAPGKDAAPGEEAAPGVALPRRVAVPGLAAEGAEEAELEIEGGGARERYRVGGRWRRLRVDLPGERLTLRWPPPPAESTSWGAAEGTAEGATEGAAGITGGSATGATLERALRELEEGREALLHATFGELYSMRWRER